MCGSVYCGSIGVINWLYGGIGVGGDGIFCGGYTGDLVSVVTLLLVVDTPDAYAMCVIY